MICPKCHYISLTHHKFCPVDGTKLESQPRCVCGEAIYPDVFKFCGHCGAGIAHTPIKTGSTITDLEKLVEEKEA